MHKRILLPLLLLALLCGCAAHTATAPTEPARDPQQLVGVWRNAGQYSEGHDFVETMTLDGQGSVTVQLEYQGAPYQTLEGRYQLADDMLYTEFEENGDTVARNFKFTLDGRELTLETETKTVTYIKVG